MATADGKSLISASPKFVEDSTSLNTLRESLTPGYGAPEQWRGEGPTAATDIYALGCIMHALLTGFPPFQGSQHEVREAHLHESAPALDAAGPRLSALVGQMLRKSPDARPTLQRSIDIFTKEIAPTQSVAGRHAGLANIAKLIVIEQAAADAKAQAEKTLNAQREELTKEAQDDFFRLRHSLFQSIKEEADAAILQQDKLTLGWGTLAVTGAQPMARVQGGAPNLPACNWDVAAFGYISVARPHIDNGARFQEDNSYTWSATLAFAKPILSLARALLLPQFQPSAQQERTAKRGADRPRVRSGSIENNEHA